MFCEMGHLVMTSVQVNVGKFDDEGTDVIKQSVATLFSS